MGEVVLLTVPHRLCISKENLSHTCDIKAEEFARSIYKNLNKAKLLLGDLNRSGCDLNRAWCYKIKEKQSNFKKVFEEYLRKKNELKFILDIHSFPTSSELYHELYIFVIVDDIKSKTQANELHDFLEKNKIDAPIINASDTNHIIFQSYKAGIPALLLEINEDLDSSKINEFSLLITNWLSKKMSVNSECPHCKKIIKTSSDNFFSDDIGNDDFLSKDPTEMIKTKNIELFFWWWWGGWGWRWRRWGYWPYYYIYGNSSSTKIKIKLDSISREEYESDDTTELPIIKLGLSLDPKQEFELHHVLISEHRKCYMVLWNKRTNQYACKHFIKEEIFKDWLETAKTEEDLLCPQCTLDSLNKK